MVFLEEVEVWIGLDICHQVRNEREWLTKMGIDAAVDQDQRVRGIETSEFWAKFIPDFTSVNTCFKTRAEAEV